MFSSTRLLLIALVSLVPLGLVKADQPGTQLLDRTALAPMQEAARELVREIEYLQEDIVTDLTGQKERTLYRQADAVLGEADRFQQALKPGMPRAQVAKAFAELDEKLHQLVKAVQALGSEQRLLQRSAARVAAADELLHDAIAQRDTSDVGKRKLLERQTRVFVTAAAQLDRTAEYAVGAVQGRGVLVGNLNKFSEAVKHFQKSVAGGATIEQLRKEFIAVNQAWERVILGLKDLKPQEYVHLLRNAGRVDRLHERLFQLLGMDGERPHLIIRT